MCKISTVEHGQVFETNEDGTVKITGVTGEAVYFDEETGDLSGLPEGWNAVVGIWGSDPTLEPNIVADRRTVEFLHENYPEAKFAMVSCETLGFDEPECVGWAIMYNMEA